MSIVLGRRNTSILVRFCKLRLLVMPAGVIRCLHLTPVLFTTVTSRLCRLTALMQQGRADQLTAMLSQVHLAQHTTCPV